MLNTELVSIMMFVLEAAGRPKQYTDVVMDKFEIPSIYFPPPVFKSKGATLGSYALDYSWYVKCFAVDAPAAYGMAARAANAMQRNRLRIPLLDEDGGKTGGTVLMKDPGVKMVEQRDTAQSGRTPRVAQLTLAWDSYEPYNTDDAEMIMRYVTKLYYKTKG